MSMSDETVVLDQFLVEGLLLLLYHIRPQKEKTDTAVTGCGSCQLCSVERSKAQRLWASFDGQSLLRQGDGVNYSIAPTESLSAKYRHGN